MVVGAAVVVEVGAVVVGATVVAGKTVVVVVGVVVAFFTRPEEKPLTGLVWEKGFYRSLKVD